MGFLNSEGQALFIKQITSANSYDDVAAEYKLWLDEPFSIPKKYLNEPAKKYIESARKGN